MLVIYDPENRIGFCATCSTFLKGDEKNRCICCTELVRRKVRISKAKRARANEKARLHHIEEKRKLRELGNTPLTIAMAKRRGKRLKKYD